MEILRLDSCYITLRDLAELEHYENLKEAHLRWYGDFSVKEALPMLKRCANLHRLTLANNTFRVNSFYPLLEELCEFIMELKDLTFLHIIYRYISNCHHFKSLFGQVKAFVLPCRPNFKFYISCCARFPESRVPTEFF